VDVETEIREFLSSRRARLSPDQIGLPVEGGRRRVPGLRRTEVALRAGVSVEYYTRLERGDVGGVSDGVLEALARALDLDEAERDHLFNLVEATKTATLPRRPRTAEYQRPNVQYLLDAINAPALLRTRHRDVLSANSLGQALYSWMLSGPARPANHARFMFRDPRAQEFYVDWEPMAERAVAMLRAEAFRNPDDPALSDLVTELSAQSEPFRTFWAAHDIRFFGGSIPIRLRHHVVGELSLTFEALELVADRGLQIGVYSAEPGSPSAEKLLGLARSTAGTHN
jgi:transcriptional regulator with XRE-family HTH domain